MGYCPVHLFLLRMSVGGSYLRFDFSRTWTCSWFRPRSRDGQVRRARGPAARCADSPPPSARKSWDRSSYQNNIRIGIISQKYHEECKKKLLQKHFEYWIWWVTIPFSAATKTKLMLSFLFSNAVCSPDLSQCFVFDKRSQMELMRTFEIIFHKKSKGSVSNTQKE